MSSVNARPVPVPCHYVDTAPFWEGVAKGEYRLQRCRDTGRFQYPPRPVSLYTGRRNLEWVTASGRGRLYAWTLTRSAWPGHEARVPYLCALVDLDEGVRVLGNLVDVPVESLQAGMAMTLVYESLVPGQQYPAFTPAVP